MPLAPRLQSYACVPPSAGNVYVDQEWSAFGVAELMVWNRVLSLTELTEVQSWLTTKYGLVMQAPPLPPSPPPSPPPAPCNPQLVPTSPVFLSATTTNGPWSPYIRWYPDQTADFIWNTPSANVNAAANINIYFYTTVQVQQPTVVTIPFQCDDHASLWVNNVAIASTSSWTQGAQPSVTLQPGSPNVIMFLGVNTGGPSGLIASVMQGSTVLRNTAQLTQWTWTLVPLRYDPCTPSLPPSPPNPPPPVPPAPPVPSAPAIAPRRADSDAWVSWEQTSFNGAGWYAGYEGSNTCVPA